jgi:hypothetical protein
MTVSVRCDCATSLAEALIGIEAVEPPPIPVAERADGPCLWCGSETGEDPPGRVSPLD